MRDQIHASPDDIDITTLWGALRRAGPKLVIASLITGGLAYGVLSMMAPRYSSEAQLAVVAKGSTNPFSDPKREGSAPDSVTVRMDKEAVNTHVKALLSPDLAAKIASDMKLAQKVEFNSALGAPDMASRLLNILGFYGPRPGESETDRVQGAYFKQLEVYSPKESRFIGIRFTSMEPQLAADIANQIAETYRASLANQTVVENNEVQKALEPKIARLVEEVGQAEAEVERFRGQANIFKGGPQNTGLNEQQLGELTGELTKAKAARSEAEARAKSAKEMMQRGSAEVLPDVQRSPLIQNLVQQRVKLERQISELSASLLAGHPRMQQLNADLGGLKRQITAEVGKVVESLEKEAKVSALREESVKKSLDELKSKVVSTGTDEVKLRQLETVAKSKRSELERLQAQYEANRARADSRVVPVEAQIVTQARASSVPVFPKKGPYAGLVMAATMLFGLAWVITRALLVGARSSSPAAAHKVVPAASPVAAKPARAEAGRAVASEPQRAAEPDPEPVVDGRETVIKAMGALSGRIAAKAGGHGAVRTALTGETDNVEMANEAAELARGLSASGRSVILVDWSPSGDGIAARIGLGRGAGLNEIIAGTSSFGDAVKKLSGSTAHVIGCGAILDEGADVDADQLNLILDALDEAYDHVLVAGRNEEMRVLFEALQGRFDVGVTVCEGGRRNSPIQDQAGTFLGYEVTGIDVIRYERGASATQRIMRQTGRPEMRPS